MFPHFKHGIFAHKGRKVIAFGLILASLAAAAALAASDQPLRCVDQVIYVDCEIDVNSSNTYDPFSRTCVGGSATVFKSLQDAAGSVIAGQTVLIRQGNYCEQLKPAQSGTADNYITFKSYPGEQATITGASLDPAVDISGRSYLIIEDMKIANVCKWLHAVGANHNIIRRNHFFKALHV